MQWYGLYEKFENIVTKLLDMSMMLAILLLLFPFVDISAPTTVTVGQSGLSTFALSGIPPSAADSVVYIMRDQIFPQGNVVAFEVTIKASAVPIRLQVWRPLVADSMYQLIGEKRIVNSVDQILKVELSFEEFIEVKSGDLLGYTVEGYQSPVKFKYQNKNLVMRFTPGIHASFSTGYLLNASQALSASTVGGYIYGIRATVYTGEKADLIPRSYVGCFKESRQNRQRLFAMSVFYDANNLSPVVCQTECASWNRKYCALTNGRFCFCSDTLPDGGTKVADTNCDAPCTDTSSGTKCGGLGDYISVYKSLIPITDLRVTSPVNIIQTGQSNTFAVAYDKGEDLLFSMDYGDGSLTTTNNATNLFTKQFGKPGEFDVTVNAMDASGLGTPVAATTKVLVQEPVANVQLMCPPFVVTFEELSCNATVLKGSGLSATFSWGDGTSETLTVTDPEVFSAGPLVSQHDANDTSLTGTVYVMPSSEFEKDGTLLSFEYYSKQVGDVEFMVLQPTCTSPAYCYGSNDCIGSCSDPRSVSCGMVDHSCWKKAECEVNTLISPCQKPDRYPSANAPYAKTGYTVKAKLAHTIPSLGYNLYKIDLNTKQIAVSQGDIIGYKSITGKIGTRVLQPSKEVCDYKQSGTVTIEGTNYASGSLTAFTGERHLLSAYASKPTVILAYHEFKTPNTYTVAVAVKNDLISTTDATANAIVEAQLGVNASIIVSAECAATGQAFTLSAQPHTGDAVNYTWTFGDGNTLVTQSPTITHTFAARGTYNVSLTIANVISSKFNFTDVCVQDSLSNLQVTAPHCNVSDSQTFPYSLATGSDYVCTWNMADGTFETNNETTALSGSVSHAYSSEGDVTINVTCINAVSFVSVVKSFKVLHPITNLRIEPKAAKYGQGFQIKFYWDVGTNPTFTLWFNNVQYPVTVSGLSGFTANMGAISAYGSRPVKIRGVNLVSDVTIEENFTIESEIVNPTTSVSPGGMELDVGGSATFTVNMASGTGVEVTIDYKDGSAVDTYTITTGQNWPTVGYVKTHIFNKPGEFDVEIRIKNNLGSVPVRKHRITVYNLVDGSLTLNSNSPLRLPEGSAAKVEFHFTQAPGNDPPTKAEIDFVYKDGTTESNIPFSLGTKHNHDYALAGRFVVEATVRNKRSNKTFITNVDIVEAITELELHITPKHAPVGQPVTIGVSMSAGGAAQLRFNFGDGSTPVTKTRIATTAGGQDKEIHTYTHTTAQRVITVDATNLLGKTTKTYVFRTLYPVTRDFTWTCNTPAVTKISAGNELSFKLKYPAGKQVPEEASYLIKWGDGSEESATLASISFTTSHTFKHLYSTTGAFASSITVFNLATSETFTIQVGVYEALSSISVVPKFEEVIGFGDVPGKGTNNNEFPLNKPVKFYISHTGTATMYHILAKSSDAVDACQKQTSPAEIQFNKAGTYDVDVTAVNGLANQTQNIQVKIVDNVDGSCSSAGITAPGENNVIKCKFTRFTTDSCLYTKTKYNDVDYVGEEYYYGDESACLPTSSRRRLLGVSGVTYVHRGSITNNFDIIRKYSSPGEYDVLIKAYNPLSQVKMDLNFPVSTAKCQKPVLAIKDVHPLFDKPFHINGKDKIIVIGQTTLACEVTLKNNKLWKVEKVNRSTGAVIENVPITHILSHASAELALPERELKYGVYKFTYSVVMDPTAFPPNELFRSETHTYIEVIKSALIPTIVENGNSMMKVRHATIVTLDPAKLARDPDIDPSLPQGITEFTWFCRQIDEKFTLDANGRISSAVKSRPYDHNQAKQITTTGGCFKQGPGMINIPPSQGTLRFSTNNMVAGETYEFIVYVKKDTRVSKGKLHLKVVASTLPIPDVVIGCTSGVWCDQTEEGQRVRSDVRLGLTASCKSGCGNNMQTSWNMEMYGINGAWILMKDFEKYVTGTTGTGSTDISISASFFQDNEQISKFRIQYSAAPPGGESGVAYMILDVNPKPSPGIHGNCSVTPLEGTVMDTEFTLQCSGWSDSDTIAMYRFYAKFKGDDIEKLFYVGDKSSVTMKFPLGPSYDNYTMSVYAAVSDGRQATRTVLVNKVQVIPLSETDLNTKISKLVSEVQLEKGNVVKTAETGNLLETSKVAIEVSSILNTQRKNHHSAASCENSVIRAPSQCYSPYCDANVPSPVYCTEEQLEEVNKARNDRSVIRDKMIEGITQSTVPTVFSLQISMSTLNEATLAPEEVSRASQTKIADFLDRAADVIKREGPTIPIEELTLMLKPMLSVVSNLEEAMNIGINYGLNSDHEAAKLTPAFKYVTDLEADRIRVYSNDPVSNMNRWLHDTNSVVQKEAAVGMTQKVFSATDKLFATVRENMIAGEPSIVVTAPRMKLILQKNTADNLLDKEVVTGSGSVDFPSLCQMTKSPGCSGSETISLEVKEMSFAPFQHVKSASLVSSDSTAINIDLFGSNNDKLSIENSAEIEINIPRDAKAPEPEAINVTSHLRPNRSYNHLFYHSVVIEQAGVALHVAIVPENKDVRFLALVSFPDGATENFPNMTTMTWEYTFTVPQDLAAAKAHSGAMDSSNSPYMIFIDNDKIKGRTGKVVIGLRQLAPNEPSYDDANRPSKTPEAGTGQITSDYQLLTYTSGCFFYEEASTAWRSRGCRVGSNSTFRNAQCFCTHLTTFAGGWVVVPNKIDWNFVFSNMDFHKNPTLYITLIVIFAIYLLCAIWARRQDNKDKEKLGVTPLPDNDSEDKYLYEVVVFTGMRRNAGTDSKVHFIISGEYDETDVRILEDNKRKILRRGSQDSFLMAVPRPLGALNYIRVWHDNSGKGKFASWYLKYILIQDLQTKEKFYFISNRWFAVEEEDGQVDRLLPVAGPEQMMEFGHLFSQRTAKNMGDGHLWFSVVARPPQSRFTRLQRVSCCLCLLCTTMVTNAMFYEVGTSTGNVFTIGPFALSPEQISIGIASNLIVFPINFLVMTLFRRSRLRKKRPSRIQEAIKKNNVKHKMSSSNTKYSLTRGQSFGDIEANRPISVISSRPGTGVSRPRTPSVPAKKRNKKRPLSFPWWVSIISWMLLWLTVAASSAFVIFYGVMFGDIKCKKWITSMLVSFFTSVFLTQPIKVILVATFFSLIIRRASEEEEDTEDDEEDIDLDPEEVYLHFPHGQPAYGAAKPRKIAYRPPDPESLERARDMRIKELKMFDILREITFYALFLFILFIIGYRLRDPFAYNLHKGLEDIFIRQGQKEDLTEVRSVKQYWKWIKHTVSPGLRASTWYNGDQPFGQRGYIKDRCGRIMGYATLRQLRVKKGACAITDTMQMIMKECNPGYTILDEETRDYGTGWQPLNITASGNNSRFEYTYRSGSILDSYPYWGVHSLYGGGGYVFEFRGSANGLLKRLEQLEREEWIDKYTRALFVEFTIYNPNVNLFSASTILSENLHSGGIFSSWRFEPMNLLGYYTNAMLFQIICEVIFLMFVVFFIVRDIRRIIAQRRNYLKEFWNWVDLTTTVLSVGSIVLYFYRLLITNSLISTFKESHGNEYIKFQYVSNWNILLTYFVAWIVFLASVKFIRLLRFNKRMSMMSSTLRYAAENLLMFGLVFAIVFFAFVQFFYLIYSIQLENFSSFINSAETCLQMFLGRFNFYAMQANAPFLGPFFFFIYVITVGYILINMFLVILNESFSAVRADISKQNNDYEMVDFIIRRFKIWTGIGNPNQHMTDKELMMAGGITGTSGVKPAFEMTIDKFPEKVEHLLNSISKVYFDTERFDDIFDSNSKDSLRGMILKERYKRAVAGHGSGPSKLADVEELEKELRMV